MAFFGQQDEGRVGGHVVVVVYQVLAEVQGAAFMVRAHRVEGLGARRWVVKAGQDH